MERKRLVPDRTPKTEQTLAANRERLSRALRSRNQVDGACAERAQLGRAS